MAGLKGMSAYSLDIKREAVKLYFENGFTKRQIREKLGIKSDTQLEGWFRAYRKDGIDGLEPARMGRPRKPTVTTAMSDAERIKQLEMENELLRNFLLELERG